MIFAVLPLLVVLLLVCNVCKKYRTQGLKSETLLQQTENAPEEDDCENTS
jgi:hypothetical protein